jgi:hypothetical protein
MTVPRRDVEKEHGCDDAGLVLASTDQQAGGSTVRYFRVCGGRGCAEGEEPGRRSRRASTGWIVGRTLHTFGRT